MNRPVWMPVLTFTLLGTAAFVGTLPASLRADDVVPSIRLNPLHNDDVTRSVFDLLGLPSETLHKLATDIRSDPDWQRIFSVSVDDEAGVLKQTQRPPVVGKYTVVDGAIRFQPRYPLERGLRYQARFDPTHVPGNLVRNSGIVTALFRLPKRDSHAPTRVTRIDPTVDVLPENQLKLYITFSAPMSRGEIYRYVRLLNPTGEPVDLPFLELGEELWDPTGTRVTLLFDPGRIKRGLKPREEAGPVLEEGKRYTFVVETDWQDAEGNKLAARAEKRFEVGPPDSTPPNPENWEIVTLRRGSRAPLVVRVPEPLDRALFANLLSVERANGVAVPGEVSIADSAREWRFIPRDAWRPGGHALVIGTELEDLAGNSIARPFEVDVFEKIPAKSAPEFVRLPFEPRAEN